MLPCQGEADGGRNHPGKRKLFADWQFLNNSDELPNGVSPQGELHAESSAHHASRQIVTA